MTTAEERIDEIKETVENLLDVESDTWLDDCCNLLDMLAKHVAYGGNKEGLLHKAVLALLAAEKQIRLVSEGLR